MQLSRIYLGKTKKLIAGIVSPILIMLLLIPSFGILGGNVPVNAQQQIASAADFGDMTGSVTRMGCGTIGGETKTITLNQSLVQEVQVCQHGEDYYEIVTVPDGFGCLAAEAFGRDPSTNTRYSFANDCNIPRGCDPSNSWSSSSGEYFSYKLTVRADDKDFQVILGAGNVLCSWKEFVQEEKLIAIDLVGRKGTSSIELAIPTGLLSGDLQLLEGGANRSDFRLDSQGEVQIMTFDVEFERDYQHRSITVIGTRVIPEFSMYAIILAVVTGMSLVAVYYTRPRSAIL